MADIITETNMPSNMVAQVLNGTWNLGIAKASEATGRVNSALTTLDTVPSMTAASVAIPTVSEPTVTVPAEVDGTAFDKFDTLFPEITAKLTTDFSTFITTYFPTSSSNTAIAEAWLLDAIQNPDSVLPSTLANQIWEGDRSRIAASAVQATEAVADTWAARGFTLPPGVAIAQTNLIQQKAQEELGNSSRAVAIKTFELAYDKLKFAIEKMIDLRKVALASAAEYIKAEASAADVTSRVVNIGYDAQSKLIAAVSQLYGARIEAEKLAYSARQHNSDLSQAAALENLKSEITALDGKVKSIVADAQATAHMAASLFNNAHVSAAVSGNIGIGYHYSNDTTNEAPALVASGL